MSGSRDHYTTPSLQQKQEHEPMAENIHPGVWVEASEDYSYLCLGALGLSMITVGVLVLIFFQKFVTNIIHQH
ncbi:unnamed protein product [Cyprideis torosa]|uniref:Uncharacterized protein n=1 Tax=Cyprideis torosa TaxID=163714 RepID=A0A7R8WF80_9CRUS|nr:unnamed protein product [Cyprideis torosa]CAG0893783.1 unnamed protein product [Cyprideis torosa]